MAELVNSVPEESANAYPSGLTEEDLLEFPLEILKLLPSLPLEERSPDFWRMVVGGFWTCLEAKRLTWIIELDRT